MAPFCTERRSLRGLHAARAALWATLFCSIAFASHSVLLQAQRFSAPTTITTGNRPAALLAADFTATGTPELLALDAGASASASSVRVLANTAGAFSVGSSITTAGSALLAMPRRPGMLPSTLPDLYWAAVSGGSLTLMRASAQTGGTYTPGTALTTFPLSGSATPHILLAAGGLHAGYANSVIVADSANNQLYTVLPNPDGTYAIQPVYGYPGLPLIAGATQLLTADLNGDGLPDLLVAGAAGVQVFLAQGNGATSFSGFNNSTIYPCTGTVQSIALADMDGDTHSDLLVEGANGRIDIYHGNGDGTFSASSEVGTGADNAATGNGGHLVGVADLDGDGSPDLVLANPRGITVLLGTGSRNFQLNATYAAGATPTQFVFTDLNGDGRPDIAFDSPEGVTILDAQGLATVTAITNLVNPIFYGQEIGYTNGIDATVSVSPADPLAVPPPGASTEGGLIYVYLDGALVCSLTVGATSPTGGPQRCNDANFQGYAAGTHTMIGAYQGNSYYAPSTSDPSIVVILPDDTASQFTTSLTPSTFGTAVRFTAIVSAPYATPAGPVAFLDGMTPLGSVPLDANGMAAFTTSTLAVGTHNILAIYAATQNFNGSQGAVAQVVIPAAASMGNDFTFIVNPSDVAIGVGNTLRVTVTVAPVGSFNQSVTLTCSGLPWESTCAFLATTIPAPGGSTQLVIHPEAPHNCSDSAQYFIAGESGRFGLVLAVLTALLIGFRRRRIRPMLFAAALCLLPVLTGCGLGGHCTDLGTRPGTYTFTVTGSAAGNVNVSHTQTVRMRAYLDGEPL